MWSDVGTDCNSFVFSSTLFKQCPLSGWNELPSLKRIPDIKYVMCSVAGTGLNSFFFLQFQTFQTGSTN